MRVPFHSLRFDIDPTRALTHVSDVLAEPALRVHPLLDTLDIPYAYDVVLTDGFAATVLGYFLFRAVIRFVKRY